MTKIMKGIMPVLLLLMTLLCFQTTAFAAVTEYDVSVNGDRSIIATYDDTTFTLNVVGTGAIKDFDTRYQKNPFPLNVTTITVGEGITRVGDLFASGKKQLSTISLPTTLKSIGDTAFEKCGLTSLSIPEGVISIGRYAFYFCDSLQMVNLPSTLTTMGDSVFGSCNKLKTFNMGAKTLTLGTAILPTTVDANITGRTATLQANQEYLGDALTSLGFVVTYQGTATAEEKFSSYPTKYTYDLGATAADKIKGHYSEYTKHLEIQGTGALENYYSNTSSPFDTSNTKTIKISEGITRVGNYFFEGKHHVQTIQLPTTLKSIGRDAFCGCINLATLNIPDGVTSIGAEAFLNCNKLQTLTIPEGEITIGNDTFAGCNSLVSLTLPSTIITIGDNAFKGCENLKTLNIPNGVTSIGNSAFYGCKRLEVVNIPNGVTSIGENTFYQCFWLTTLTLPEGVTSIGDSAFFDCSSLQTINIPNGVTAIKRNTFRNCSSLTTLTLPEGVTSIGEGAFMDCSKLQTINIPNGVTAIKRNTFRNCSSLTTLTLPEGVTSIGEGAFMDCSKLQTINIPSGVTSIGRYAFNKCSSLQIATIPEGVISIGEFAFDVCSSLQTVNLPSTLTTMDRCAFMGSTKLKTFNLGAKTVTLGTGILPTTVDASITGRTATLQASQEYLGDALTLLGFTVTYQGTATAEEKFTSYPTRYTYDLGATAADKVKGHYSDYTYHLEVQGTGAIKDFTEYHRDFDYTDVKSLTIGEGITRVGDFFAVVHYYMNDWVGFLNLKTLTLPSTLQSIGTCALTDITNLKTLTLPAAVEDMGVSAFYGSYIEYLKIPKDSKLKSIGRRCFYSNLRLKSITLPDGLTSIGDNAFERNRYLESITLPATLTSLGNNTFKDCDRLNQVTNLSKANQTVGTTVFPVGRGTTFKLYSTNTNMLVAAKEANAKKIIFFDALGGTEILNYVDSAEVNFPDVQPRIISNEVVSPLRFILQDLGATVLWDDVHKQAIVRKEENGKKIEIMLAPNTNVMTVNGAEYTDTDIGLDATVILENGRLLLPGRAIVKAWDTVRFKAERPSTDVYKDYYFKGATPVAGEDTKLPNIPSLPEWQYPDAKPVTPDNEQSIIGGYSPIEQNTPIIVAASATILKIKLPILSSFRMDSQGVITCSTGEVENLSPLGQVVITDIRVVTFNGWTISPFDADYKNMGVSKTTFGLKINDAEVPVTGIVPMSAQLLAPIANGTSKPLTFEAKLTGQANNITAAVAGIIYNVDFKKV
ncbi:MAG: leucine-rich repeat protein [Anaerovoracaceae bacterium]